MYSPLGGTNVMLWKVRVKFPPQAIKIELIITLHYIDE